MQANIKILVFLVLFSNLCVSAEVQNESDEGVYNLVNDEAASVISENQFAGSQGKNIKTSLNIPITLRYENSNLCEIIKEITKQKKINFVFDDRLLDIKNVSIDVEDEPLYLVLNCLLTPHNISYYEFEPGEVALAKQSRVEEKTGAVKGSIYDENGGVLIGAHVIIKETGIGCVTDLKGHYHIKNINPGEYILQASYIGYEKTFQKIKITPGSTLEINFNLKAEAFLIGGIEVVAAADLLPREVTSTTTITGGEVEHFQASSIKDVLELVPGIQKTDNPGLGKTTQVALRGNNNDVDKSSVFGTLIVVDGSPVSNNANLQFERPSPGTFGTSNLNGGVDLRTIPADNIENIEIITGLPSVKYGDATAGVINIKTKIGATPNRIKIKNNPDTREGNFEGGVMLGDGSLSYNLNAAQSERDVRITGDEYLRLTGQMVYSKNFFDNTLSTNNKISLQKILDEEEPEGENLQQTKNYNRGFTVTLSSWGKYKIDEAVSSIDYSVYATMRRENSMRSKLVTDYVVLPSGDTVSNYIGKIETRGVEWTLGGRVEWNNVFYTGDYVHKILVGVEPQYNANTGEGVVFDTLLNYYGVSSGKRPYKFDDVPGQLILGMYAEDKITGRFIFDFSLMLGFRYEMYRPTGFNLSGLWGNGDLVESRQGSFFNPRLNLMIYLSNNNQLRLSAGTASKSPAMGMLYQDKQALAWRNPDDKQKYFIQIDRWQPDLKGFKESLYEISYDHKIFNKVGITATAYYKFKKGNLFAYDIPVFQTSQIGDSYKVYYVGKYSLYSNEGKKETKGLDFTLRTSKIEALNMDFNVTGSYSFIKTPGVGYTYSNTSTSPDSTVGQYPNYHVPNVPIDTMIGWTYRRGDEWNDRLQINYSLRYTVPSLGLWITIRAEQLLFERSQDHNQGQIDFNVASEKDIAEYLFNRAIKRKPNKWLFSFNMSKSLFKGAELSFYVNNFLDDAAIRRYYSSTTDISEDKRNPDLFYGLEFSMMLGTLFK